MIIMTPQQVNFITRTVRNLNTKVVVNAGRTTTSEQSQLGIIANSKRKLTTNETETLLPLNIAKNQEVVVTDPSTSTTTSKQPFTQHVRKPTSDADKALYQNFRKH